MLRLFPQPRLRRSARGATLVLATLVTSSANAQEPARPAPGRATLKSQTRPFRSQTDGVYGRLDGDLDFGVGVGALTWTGGGPVLFGARTDAHYFSTLGIWGEAFWNADAGAPETLGLGIALKPLFLPRWLLNLQQGPPTFDLFLDSAALGLGWQSARHPRNDGSPEALGTINGLHTSFGMGVPLMADAAGPWLEARGSALFPVSSGVSSVLSAQLLVSWHILARSPWLIPARE